VLGAATLEDRVKISWLSSRAGLALSALGAHALDPSELARDPSASPVRPAAAETSADECVGFHKTDIEKGVEYLVRNSCERKLACQVSWKVACENGNGDVTQRRSEQARFVLKGSEEHTVQASANTCKAGWRIDDVAWSCN
jgi:hypothetical protein